MQFPVLTDEQIESFSDKKPDLVEGKATFEVVDANESMSKAGNEMVVIKLKIYDQNNNEGSLLDYLVASEKASFKIKAFWDSAGRPDMYTAGNFIASDCLGASGECMLKMQRSQEFGDRMRINYYIPAKSTKKPDEKSTTEIKDDDIPF